MQAERHSPWSILFLAALLAIMAPMAATLAAEPIAAPPLEQSGQATDVRTLPPAPATLAEAEMSVSGFVEERALAWRNHVRDLVTVLPDMPAEFAAAGARLMDGLEGRGLGEVALLLGVFVGLGAAAELLFAWATHAVTQRIETKPFTTVHARTTAVLTGLSLGLARVLCFTAGSLGGFLAMSWPPQLRRLVLGYLVAVLALRVTLALGRFLFAPGNERLRVVPMNDGAARFWHRWNAVFVGWFAIGYVTIELLRQLGMSLPAAQDLAYVLGLGLLAIVIRMIWRPGRPPHVAGRIVRTILAVLCWIAWVISARAFMWLLIIGAALAMAIPALHRGVMHLYRPAEVTPEGDHPPTVPVWAVVFERGARALLIVGGLWVLVAALGLDMSTIAGAETPATRLLNGAVHAVVILLLADLVWQLARTAIDRRLGEAHLDVGGHGAESDPTLTPEETRRLGRIRTLLPILRIVLFVVLAVMAVLMALSELGVQIAPLIAGAGVVGVAVGFGSQTLVKDIISGMFYLLDDAFRVGEYIVSGNYRGTVEGFSLRSIRLRHHRGPIFTVPFGMLGAIQNLSRDWVIDKITVGVTYDTDLDLVKKVVKQVSREIMADPTLAKGIIEPLKSQGVAAMGDFAIQIRMKFMAKPGEQFIVRRAIYDKIKKAFNANGIKFAFPTVTVAGGDSRPNAAVAQQAIALTQKPAAE
ncbi:MAG: mechanosensitive ion channel family protein [Geminicoccaceae bacterium]